jgi:YegS/Rv2252/BmrU family lipid kinase
MRKIALICNVQTGLNSKKRLALEFATSYLKQNEIASHSIHTFDLEELQIKLYEALRQGFKEFLVLGGDGSLHHLVNILMKQELVPFYDISVGVLPCGTGNDWLRTYYDKNVTESVLKSVVENKTKKQDIGKIIKNQSEIIYFVNIAGVGFNGFLMQYIDKFKKIGDWAYYVAIFYTFWHYKPVNVSIENHFKKSSIVAFMISIGICKYAGGNMKLCPEAISDDGLFEVNVIENVSFWDLIKNILFLKDGSYIQKMNIKTQRCTSIYIHSPEILYLEADGESYGSGIFSFESISDTINFY